MVLMQSLQKREKASNVDSAEFHDEEEQEHILQELGASNAASNLQIQRGLVAVGALLTIVYFMFLNNLFSNAETFFSGPVLPVPFLSQPVVAHMPWPALWCAHSILSIGISIYTFLDTCEVRFNEICSGVPARRKLGSVSYPLLGLTLSMGIAPPLAALSAAAHWIELVFWGIPLLLLGMEIMAVYMMKQVDNDMDALERSRYTFKGA